MLRTDLVPAKIEQIGYGCMKMGYYLIAFDHIATDRFYDSRNIGLELERGKRHSVPQEFGRKLGIRR
jgi:hypothetical protein